MTCEHCERVALYWTHGKAFCKAHRADAVKVATAGVRAWESKEGARVELFHRDKKRTVRRKFLTMGNT